MEPWLKISPLDVTGVCDHTFLQRPECFRGKDPDPLAAYERAMREFLENTAALPRPPYAVCLRTEEIARAAAFFAASTRRAPKLAAVVGFPLGDLHPTEAKVAEAKWALDAGATEIDMVIRWRALKAGEFDAVAADVAAVMDAVFRAGGLLKAILEVCELTDHEIRRACAICANTAAHFVKTSTGFGRGGATPHALKIMRESFGGGVKISGGVTKDNWRELLAAALDPDAEKLDPRRVRIGESSLLPLD